MGDKGVNALTMYYSDKPICTSDEDLLGRKGFAKILAQSILNLKTSDTFSIGLFGKWGSGKTSVVNMTLNELEALQKTVKEDDQIVVVHFEPWNFSTTDQLLSQFFIRLSNEFKSKRDKSWSKIADALEEYSGALDFVELVPKAGSSLSSIKNIGIKSIARKLRKGDDRKDIQKQKEYTIELLKQQHRRILVVIDDIDRLSSEQIRQIFQLIASVAKFPNTMYLLVFDRDIVVSALKDVQTRNGEDYLEKIIQMPIQIPDIQKDKITAILIEKLNAAISNYSDICFQREHWQKVFSYCIEPFIKNLRDINRLCNSVQFKLTTISSEVDFADMVAISTVEIALPKVYEWIKSNKPILTGSFDVSTFMLRDKPQNELYNKFFDIIKALLNEDTSTELAIDALSHLFPHFGNIIGKNYDSYNTQQLRRDNRIAHPDKFYRYFSFDLNDTEIRKADVERAVYACTSEEFRDYLLKLDAVGSSYDFLVEVNAVIPEVQPERAATIIRALVNTSTELGDVSANLLSLNASTYADHMIVDLLAILAPEESLQLLEEVLKESTRISLPSIANVINMIELGYGRLAANGEERRYKKVVSLENLILLEKNFTERAKEMLSGNSLFDFSNWGLICFLLEYFDPGYIKDYLTASFREEKNIAYYLDGSISEWIGGGTEYEVRDDYKKYLTDDQVSHAIEFLRNSGGLFLLPIKIQNKCAAFALRQSGSADYRSHVPQNDVNKLLSKWQTEKALKL